MEHRPPIVVPLVPPPPTPELVTPSVELTGAHVAGDDVLLEMVVPRDAWEELDLRFGTRYDLTPVAPDEGRHVPLVVSSSIALTKPEIAALLALVDDALRRGGSVSLAVDEHADVDPWSVQVTFEAGESHVARGDTPHEALERAVAGDWADELEAAAS